jgi:DNA-binding MarR family transcriptional regulator
MTAISSDDAQLAWANLVRSGTAVMQRVENDMKKQGFPPIAWYDVLWELEKAPDGRLQQSEAQSRVLLAQYNFVRLLDRLQEAGLLRRVPCKVDGRSNVLHLTDEGRTLRRAMWTAYDAAIAEHVGAHLSRQETGQLADLLSKLLPERPKLAFKARQSGRGRGA